jgi:hypothetical protein
MAADSAKVLTLHTLLSVVADAGRPVKLLIETKHPTRYGGLVEQELVRLLRRFGFAGDPAGQSRRGVPAAEQPVTIMSFAGVALRRVRLLAPAVPLVLLLDRPSALRRTGSLPAGVYTAGPGIRALHSEPGYVARAHAAGNRVYSWTVDEPADVQLARDLGIDAIITNRPASSSATSSASSRTAFRARRTLTAGNVRYRSDRRYDASRMPGLFIRARLRVQRSRPGGAERDGRLVRLIARRKGGQWPRCWCGIPHRVRHWPDAACRPRCWTRVPAMTMPSTRR